MQVEPAAHSTPQPPPAQLSVHVAFSLHDVVQPPDVQLPVQSLPSRQVVLHVGSVSAQARVHFPPAGQEHCPALHEPAPPYEVGGGPPSLVAVPVPVPSVKS